ncbi:hypothetical protein PHYPSEUDO_008598 [Phytophthora pseudosyringae]|uniref:Uncharacterized protein n=1 Tax=Phytophthora pseudosyringae TaxID=221518 RepID=A0A8T1WD16_9STRA|nr:hypothetical protein PHYPSEUDO_008598 [Phytophthora pseudosyringae]
MADVELLLAAVSSLDETAGGADDDLDAAERDVHAVQQLQHAKRSIQEYRYLMVHYLQWTVQNGTKQHIITKTFRDSVQRDKKSLPSRKSILAVLDSTPKYPPLYFAKLVADDFLAWVESLRRKDGARFVHTSDIDQRFTTHVKATIGICRYRLRTSSRNTLAVCSENSLPSAVLG